MSISICQKLSKKSVTKSSIMNIFYVGARAAGLKSHSQKPALRKQVKEVKGSERSEKSKLQQNPATRISMRTRSQVKALQESNNQARVQQESQQLQLQTPAASRISSRTRAKVKALNDEKC